MAPRSPAAVAPVAPLADPSSPSPSYEELFANDMRLNAARVSSVNERLMAESRDQEWATRMENLVEENASELLDGTGRVLRLECRTTLCAIRARHESEEAQAEFVSALPMRLFRELDGAFLARFTGEGGSLETHGFFVKRGHDMLLPDVQ